MSADDKPGLTEADFEEIQRLAERNREVSKRSRKATPGFPGMLSSGHPAIQTARDAVRDLHENGGVNYVWARKVADYTTLTPSMAGRALSYLCDNGEVDRHAGSQSHGGQTYRITPDG